MRIALAPGDDIAAAVRGTAAESVVVEIAPGRDPLVDAQTRAAIGPLAIEAAPGRRVNAIVIQIGADPVAVDAAARFLDGAQSTTGQILVVG